MSNTLTKLCPELQCNIADFLDEPSKVSLHLASSRFRDVAKFSESIHGKNICIACISEGYTDLFRYWLITEKIPIHDKPYFVTSVLCEAVKITGGLVPGEISKKISNLALSIMLERWYLKPVFTFDGNRIAMAAATPDDAAHYLSITTSMKLSASTNSRVLIHCIKNGFIEVANLVYTRELIHDQNISRFLKYAVNAGEKMTRWIIEKWESREDTWRNIWDIILNEAIKHNLVTMVDILLDKSLFPIEEYEEYLEATENIGIRKKADFVIKLAMRIPVLIKNCRVLANFISFLSETNEDSIKSLILEYYTPEQIHEQILKTESLSTLLKAGLYFPVIYTPDFTTKLLVMMVHNRRRDSLNLEALKISIGPSFEKAWLQFADKPEKQLYLASIVLSTGLVSPNIVLEKMVDTYSPKPVEILPANHDESEDEENGEGYDSGEWVESDGEILAA